MERETKIERDLELVAYSDHPLDRHKADPVRAAGSVTAHGNVVTREESLMAGHQDQQQHFERLFGHKNHSLLY